MDRCPRRARRHITQRLKGATGQWLMSGLNPESLCKCTNSFLSGIPQAPCSNRRKEKMKSQINMAFWAELPGELLYEILKQVTYHRDVIQFGLVCKSWSAVAQDGYMQLPPQLPLSCIPQPKFSPVLMLPSKDGSEYCYFWSPTECKVAGYLSLPETRGKWLCASSHGWVVMVDFKAPEEVVLFNPITRAQIQLPPLSSFPVRQYSQPEYYDEMPEFFFIRRAVLSADPAKDKANWMLVVVVSHVKRVCFYRPDEDKWKLVKGDRASTSNINDVLYSQGRLYAVDNFGYVSTLDFGSGTSPEFKRLPGNGEWIPDAWKYLALSSQGDLVQVTRIIEYDKDTTCGDVDDVPVKYHTEMVILHKLDASTNVWEELENLGDDILFLGPNASLCFSRSELPKLKANSVYLTDDRWSFVEDDNVRCLDLGIFDYTDETMQPFDPVDPSDLMRSVWILPSI